MSLDWRRIPSLAALRAFEATARHESFAAAARSLNVSHAAIAQQVRALEKDLNVQLAVRAGRSVGLTEAGRRLAQGLAQGFLTISDSIDDLREREASRGVRVTTTTFAADVIIMPRLSEFWRKHPGVEIALHPTPHEIDIIENGYDFALRASLKGDRVNWPGTEVEHLCDIDLMGVGAPSLLGDGDVDPTTLPWLWHDDHEIKLSLMRAAGLEVEQLKRAVIGSQSLQLEAVRQGVGVTIFNRRIIQSDLASGRVVEVPLPRKITADYYLVFPKGPRRVIVRQFADWLRTLF